MDSVLSSYRSTNIHWRQPNVFWFICIALLAALTIPFYEPIRYMVFRWIHVEEYSHGLFIPFISAFLIWQQKNELAECDFNGSWLGVLLVGFGFLTCMVGELATLYVIIQYGILLIIMGIALSFSGVQAFRRLWLPLAILILMIPLPNFLYNNLSAKLQLLSSQLGVSFIRLWDIPVYLEGNVIDLGAMKLQVVEACSGLRYLFPLMVLGFIAAYFYRAPLYKKCIIFLSTLPITVAMNSLRIGIIGITVDKYGQAAAEGFLHDFEGWVMFMGSFGLLLLEISLLTRLSGQKLKLTDVFIIDLPEQLAEDQPTKARQLPKPFWVSSTFVLTMCVAIVALPDRKEIIPERESFGGFPLYIGEWQGDFVPMEQLYIDKLKFSDYALIDYRNSVGDYLNFYVAYYDSQKSGASAHSPKSCIPGDGWKISDMQTVTMKDITDGKDLRLNRVVTTKGDRKQLVYYWFKQRHRNLTNEYLVKWYLFWDALTLNRTDGALVRLVLNVDDTTSLEMSDQLVRDFLSTSYSQLALHLPD